MQRLGTSKSWTGICKNNKAQPVGGRQIRYNEKSFLLDRQ